MARAWLIPLAAALALAPAAAAQSTRVKDLGSGKLLVANRSLSDPNFTHSVVFLVQYGQAGVVGLVLNRRTQIPISKAFNIDEAKGRSDTLYMGGPVERTSVLALTRSASKLAGANNVLGDVYMFGTQKLLAQTLSKGVGADAFRVYLGYAGWSVPQLEGEVKAGAWFIFPGDAATVFDAKPDTLWGRLIAKTETQFARNANESPAFANRAYPLWR